MSSVNPVLHISRKKKLPRIVFNRCFDDSLPKISTQWRLQSLPQKGLVDDRAKRRYVAIGVDPQRRLGLSYGGPAGFVKCSQNAFEASDIGQTVCYRDVALISMPMKWQQIGSFWREAVHRQIGRWKAIRRHIRQVQKNCEVGDLGCRPRQRQAALLAQRLTCADPANPKAGIDAIAVCLALFHLKDADDDVRFLDDDAGVFEADILDITDDPDSEDDALDLQPGPLPSPFDAGGDTIAAAFQRRDRRSGVDPDPLLFE